MCLYWADDIVHWWHEFISIHGNPSPGCPAGGDKLHSTSSCSKGSSAGGETHGQQDPACELRWDSVLLQKHQLFPVKADIRWVLLWLWPFFFVAYCVADLVILVVLVINKKRKPLTTGIVSSKYVTHLLLILCFKITNWVDSFETDHSNKRPNRAHWLFSASANQLPLLLLNLWFIWKMCLTHGEMSWDVNKDSVRPVCLHSWSCAGVKPSTEVRNDKHWCRGAARNQTTRSPQLRIS